MPPPRHQSPWDSSLPKIALLGHLRVVGCPLRSCSPHRLARSRTPPFHGENRGSNPRGDASLRFSGVKLRLGWPAWTANLVTVRDESRRLSRRSLGEGGPSPVMGFHYVSMLGSLAAPGRHYVGLTDDLGSRLKQHNSGSVPSTSNARPGRIKATVAFTDSRRAAAFERYLESGSGRVFAGRHF
jgi:putative endonuclease